MKHPDERYWNELYQAAETPWDIGYASPPLTKYIDGITKKDDRILIPGCGNAYEATYLLEHGFTNLTLIDISTTLAEKIQSRLSVYHQHVRIIAGDFFKLDEQFDFVLEQTFFCALDRSLRPNYARKMNELLKSGGKLAGVLFNREFDGGPPFGGSTAEYKSLFEPLFKINIMEPCYNSSKPRQGSELFFEVEKT